ncbi:phosphate-starvation-inducible PsiE family protein [Thermosulfuriphilus sp.]
MKRVLIRPSFQNVCRFYRQVESILYFILVLCLVAATVYILADIVTSWHRFHIEGDSLGQIFFVLDRVLLALMLLEILHTILFTCEGHILSVEPFLVIGVMASVRRILIISLEIAHPPKEFISSQKFNQYMIEMGVLGALVAVFILGIILLRRQST